MANASQNSFDLVVIGAGPGGYVAAIRAAQLGMRVACIEKDKSLGGTCLNVGCIPSKALLDSSERFHNLAHLDVHGIGVGDIKLDLGRMMARKTKVVKTLTTGIKGLFRKNAVESITGTARVLAAGRVAVDEGGAIRELSATHILIATGSVPIELPSLPFDGDRVLSSTEALTLPEVPKKLLVVGAGAIGLELGSVWSRLGAEVHVVEFLDRIVPGSDAEAARLLHKSLEKQGLTFALQTTAKAVRRIDGGIAVDLESGGETRVHECDRVLVAVGRRPYIEGLGLGDVDVAVDARGRIVVDEHYRTSVAGIYAVGDVIPGPMLAHKAEEEGIAAVERMAGRAGHVNYDAIPSVVYTAPELAGVGMTEEQARATGREIAVGTFPFLANGRARCMDETDGMAKVIADAATDRILGIHIVGAHASDVIAEAAVAMEFGASAEDIGRSVHAHPTLPEALKEAALAVRKQAIHI
jgi:dihydrolipoamide dehydrogenase